MISLLYSHGKDLGGFAFSEGFRNRMFLDTELEPAYEVREVREYVEDGRKTSYASWQKTEPVYQFRCTVLEYTFRALQVAKGQDSLFLTDQFDNVSEIEIIDIASSLVNNTDISIITVKFVVINGQIFYQ